MAEHVPPLASPGLLHQGSGAVLGEPSMQIGELLANVLTALLLPAVVCCTLFLFGKPLWPQRHARMVLISNADAVITASSRTTCDSAICLPETFDLSIFASRPQQ